MPLQEPDCLQQNHIARHQQKNRLRTSAARQDGRHRPGQRRLQEGQQDPQGHVAPADGHAHIPFLLPQLAEGIPTVIPQGILFRFIRFFLHPFLPPPNFPSRSLPGRIAFCIFPILKQESPFVGIPARNVMFFSRKVRKRHGHLRRKYPRLVGQVQVALVFVHRSLHPLHP